MVRESGLYHSKSDGREIPSSVATTGLISVCTQNARSSTTAQSRILSKTWQNKWYVCFSRHSEANRTCRVIMRDLWFPRSNITWFGYCTLRAKKQTHHLNWLFARVNVIAKEKQLLRGQHSCKAEDWRRHGSVTRAHDFRLAFENREDSEGQPVDELGGQQVAEIPRWWEVSHHQRHAYETDRFENTSRRPSLGDLNSEICSISCLNCASVRNIDLDGSTSFKISLMAHERNSAMLEVSHHKLEKCWKDIKLPWHEWFR
jgi:hypothetical protein